MVRKAKEMTKSELVEKTIFEMMQEYDDGTYSTADFLEDQLRARKKIYTSISVVRQGLANLYKKGKVHRHREGHKVYYMSLNGWRKVEQEIERNRKAGKNW